MPKPNNKPDRRMRNKSILPVLERGTWTADQLGYSYYAFCIENALWHITRARSLVQNDPVDENHELPRIEKLIAEAYAAI